MTTVYINSQTSAYVADKAATTYILDAGESIQTTDAFGIDASNSVLGRTIIVRGLMDVANVGIALGATGSPALASNVTISNSGFVLNGAPAIDAYGDGHKITNHGTIISADTASAIVATGDYNRIFNDGYLSGLNSFAVTGDNNRLVNDGTMSAVGGIIANTNTGETVFIINHGTIHSESTAIETTAGNDRIFNSGHIAGDISMGAGNDTFASRGGQVYGDILGGAGNDHYIINSTVLHIIENSGEGTDQISSSLDVELGSQEIEWVNLTGNKNTTISANSIAQTLTGNAGRNTIDGAGGADKINGNAGRDILIGGTGNDRLTGGSDADTFMFTVGDGRDTITDFELGVDRIDVRTMTAYTNFHDVITNHVTVHGTDIWIKDGTDTIMLKNVALTDLSAGDFIF